MSEISVGASLPAGRLFHVGANGPETIDIEARTKGRKVVIFAVPGAFTGTCTTAHVPSFIRTADKFREKGVEEIICISVNDPFVMKAWAEATGGDKAGITFAGDDGSYTKALGLSFDVPAVGLLGRSKRYAMLVEDGIVKVLHLEDNSGVCEISGGEALLAAI